MIKYGLIIAVITTCIDQFHKWYMINVVDIAEKQVIKVTSFFNLVMVWNPGISFGLFGSYQHSHYLFAGLASVIVLILLWWMRSMTHIFPISALGLIIGGAVGNIIDRFYYKAVADFFDVHVAGYHWPAFNIADSAVFIGATMVCVDCFIDRKE